MEFKERLKTLRMEKNITQKEFMKQLNERYSLNLSPSTASYWELGREPSYAVLVNIADYFNCSIDYLLGASTVRNKKAISLALDEFDEFTTRFNTIPMDKRFSILNVFLKILVLFDSNSETLHDQLLIFFDFIISSLKSILEPFENLSNNLNNQNKDDDELDTFIFSCIDSSDKFTRIYNNFIIFLEKMLRNKIYSRLNVRSKKSLDRFKNHYY